MWCTHDGEVASGMPVLAPRSVTTLQARFLVDCNVVTCPQLQC